MIRRLKIIMDEDRTILPDQENNYIVGSWNGSMENAVDDAINFGREILVFRPEGLDLKVEELTDRRVIRLNQLHEVDRSELNMHKTMNKKKRGYRA